ncbi:uroporphyrinogen-III C-methyltransferase [Williamsia serinedens]|uniref:uroporphyrinogen-III C-methyltransferase n=1 Tax=Williamsia serinedens TaxID=391736 RepID=A0ABT1GZQ5_9NOCA|nr:uroporphyrinogen-III C-methyltransferase [Williamsia serinedens]MCP2158993.1 uroporphyrin-III C-methyltransferase / precorrin-2 dehydrogenase / sirohydrochlorin ferrochelatase [Williamsia serinedens]
MTPRDPVTGPRGGDAHYLVGLDLRGRRVVLIGGGSVVSRRLGTLVAAGADVHVIALETTPTVESFPGITVETRAYRHGDLEGAWYALACTDDPDVNAAVVAEAEERHIFCVRADDASRGSAATPATVHHAQLTVGVLASGDHRRSARIRGEIADALLDGTLGTPSRGSHPAGVALVGGGPGDPDLITVRGRRLLAAADVVVADRLAPPALLAELAPWVQVIDAAKVPYGRAMKQEAINAALVEHASAGKFVVRLKGGDPYVYGRGYEEVVACVEAGVPVTVVPGISSPIAAPAAAGIPVTHRGVAHEIVIVSGHIPPDHPDSLVDWDALGRLRGTVVLMMAVERLDVFADALMAGGRDASTPVSVIENGSMPGQRRLTSDLASVGADARAAGVRPPAIVVVGEVAAFDALTGSLGRVSS